MLRINKVSQALDNRSAFRQEKRYKKKPRKSFMEILRKELMKNDFTDTCKTLQK